MRKRVTFIALILIVLAMSGFTGCPGYDAARNFSAEEVKVQEEFAKTLAAQYAIVEKFADAQIAVTTWRVDQITKQIQATYAARTRAVLNADPNLTDAQKDKILLDMASAVAADSAQSEMDKLKINALVAQLKAKDAEILVAYNEIVEGTKTLDEWVQLRKFDEVLFLRLTDKLKLSQDKLNKAITDANDIWGSLIGLLPKGNK